MESVKIVTNAVVQQNLYDMASVDSNIPSGLAPASGFIANPSGLARFMVCATMLLGAADATMLATVVEEWTLVDTDPPLELDGFRVYTFPGWEVI